MGRIKKKLAKYDPRKKKIGGKFWQLSGHKISSSKREAIKNKLELKSWGLNARVTKSVRKGFWRVYTRKKRR